MSDHAHTQPPQEGSGGRRPWGRLLPFAFRRRPADPERHPTPIHHESMVRGHEPEDRASSGGVALFGAGLLVLLAVVFAGIAWFSSALRDRREGEAVASSFTGSERVPPEPRLQQAPPVDLSQMYAREDSILYTYGWVERDQGIIHVPIDRAMDLIAERGLPVRDSTVRDSTVRDSTRRVLTESGYTIVRPGPLPPSSPPYRGSLRSP